MDWELARSWCFVWIEAHICSICTAASYNVLVDDKKTSTDEHLHNVVWHCLDLDSVSLVFQPASPGKCQLVGDIHSNRSIKNSARFQKSCASISSLISANVSSCNGPLVEANRLKSTVVFSHVAKIMLANSEFTWECLVYTNGVLGLYGIVVCTV